MELKNKLAQNLYGPPDYTLSVGLQLRGPEVKFFRAYHVAFTTAYATIENGQLFLHDVSFGGQKTRKIKCLAHKNEIIKLAKRKEKLDRSTIALLRLFAESGWIKAELGLVQGQNKADKRRQIKERDLTRAEARGL